MPEQPIEHSPTISPVSYLWVSLEDLDGVWPEVASTIEKSLSYFDGRVCIDDVFKSLKDCKQQLWIACLNGEIVGAAVTEINIFPRKKILTIAYLAGHDFELWKPGIEVLKDFALHHGCKSIQIHGRKGWVRLLKDFRVLNITQVLDL